MDRPLLFLVLALVAVGVFLFLRRQDDAEKVPPPGKGVPYDPDAAARIQEVDGFVTDLTQRFAEFDTLSPVLPQDSVAGITAILGEIVQIRAELNAVDVDAESSTRKAVLARLDTFARTVEKVVRSAKVDQARVVAKPAKASGPVIFSPMFTAAPTEEERAVEYMPGGSETTKPVFGFSNVNDTLAPSARIRPEDGLTGRERFPGVKVASVISEGTLRDFQAGERTKAKVVDMRSTKPKVGTQAEKDAQAAAHVNQVDPHKPAIPAEVIHAPEQSKAASDRKEAIGAIAFDAVDSPKQLVVLPVGREVEAASTLLQMMSQEPANADGTGGVSFDSAPKRDKPETFEGDEQEMLLAKQAADPNNPARIRDDPKAFMKAVQARVEDYVSKDSPVKQLALEIAEIRSLLMAEPASSKNAVDVFDPVRMAVLTEFNILEKRLSKIQSAVKRPAHRREGPGRTRAVRTHEASQDSSRSRGQCARPERRARGGINAERAPGGPQRPE